MNNTLIKSYLICIAFVALSAFSSFAQTDSVINNESLSLKELLNVKVVSVSKTSELLFDAPLSASVVTKDEILRAGCTSIMEALRLVPGMIVREQTNGNYDIHLRGMDNVPPNSPFDITSNTTTLVMIDNRPVYSYLRGGTFWETLPVDINDVERIEVVRGPAAALYGPNAVNGVINIITRQAKKDGLYLVANTQQGSYQTSIANVSAGYRFNKKWSMIASGNYQGRDRTQTSYFEFDRNIWLDHPDYFINFTGDTIRNADIRYPNPQQAMDKYAGNLFLNYEPSDKIKYSVSAGAQHSIAQRVSTENEITPLSNTLSDSKYVDFKANIKGLSIQLSDNGGTQATDLDPGRKYDFNIIGGSMEYKFTKDNLSITPGLSYNNAVYDDRKYSDSITQSGLLNARGVITSQSASLHSEYKMLNNKLRLVAGVALNKFNYPDTNYISYEFAATYKLNKRNLIRAVYSRAPKSSNIFDAYVTKTIAYYQTGYKTYTRIALEGNKNPKLLTADMFEIGYRGSITRRLNIDVELFDIQAQNYNTPVSSSPYIMLSGTDTVTVIPIKSTDLPLTLHQQGVTLSLSWNTKKLQVKPFVTLQHTFSKNYAPFINTPDAGTPGAEQYNIYSAMGEEAKLNSTPTVFGGGALNYAVTSKFNVNISAYYYSSQTYYHLSNILFNDGVRGIDHIPSKLIMNAKVSYEPAKGFYLFSSVKNILNDKSREFFKTDATPLMILGGINYEF
ncbi:MAG: TonB-dependent receptor plug domain-containing protein [Bacteroidia bacterium]